MPAEVRIVLISAGFLFRSFAKRNITRRQPNITAKQYNPSNGNRIEKSTSKRGFFCVTASNRIWYAKKPVFEAMLCIKWIAFF